MERDPFEEYFREKEPDKLNRGYIWSTAIGLQAVDGLKPSKYLIKTAIQNIEGEISVQEARTLIDSYYKENTSHTKNDERTEEADKVSCRIAEILSETAFTFSPNEYISIHRKLFQDIYVDAGRIRDYNITKKEWILDGETVIYGSASELRPTLEYDFSKERNFSYRGLNMNETIQHIAKFISMLWQIHIFSEGNTRTTAVFLIKYMRSLGFNATNDIFAENAWYFRNALVRANYTNLEKNIHETTEYVEMFLRNLLLNEKNELSNRKLHIRYRLIDTDKIENPKVDIDKQKVDIEEPKVDIEKQKVDIEAIAFEKNMSISKKTIDNIQKLLYEIGYNQIFGRGLVMDILQIKASGASKLISNMLSLDMVEKVSGYGKGKYVFKKIKKQ